MIAVRVYGNAVRVRLKLLQISKKQMHLLTIGKQLWLLQHRVAGLHLDQRFSENN